MTGRGDAGAGAVEVAVVTGGSSGIGLATVGVLAARGMRVTADVRREADVAAAVADIADRFGRIDVLVNCAGGSMSARRRLVDTTPDEWHRLVDTNLTGTYLMCRAVLPHLQAAGGGYILNVLSTAAFRAGEGASPYAASKFGARALTEALIAEYRHSGIRITSVSPGPVDTAIWDRKLEPPSPEERARMLRPSDIAEVFAWLLDRPSRVHIPDITVVPWPGAGEPRRGSPG